MTRHLELCLQPRQFAQPRDPRHRGAGIRVGDEVEVPAFFGHVFDRNRNLPRNLAGIIDLSWYLPRRRVGFAAQASLKASGPGKTTLPASRLLPSRRPTADRGCAGITRQPHRLIVDTPAQYRRYSALRPSQAPGRGSAEARRRPLAGRKMLRRTRISRGTARSPTPISRRLSSRSRQNGRTMAAPPGARGRPDLANHPARREPAQQQHQMQHDQLESALGTIRDPVKGVKSKATALVPRWRHRDLGYYGCGVDAETHLRS